MIKTFRVADIFTPYQLQRAQVILSDGENVHRRILAEAIEPFMEDINAKTGQENDADYMAYALEWVVQQLPGWEGS